MAEVKLRPGRGSRKRGSRGSTGSIAISRKDPRVPPLVDETCTFIEKHGLEVEGLFRVTGSFKEIAQLKQRYLENEERNVDLSQYDIYSVAGVLYQFFNDLESPIFTFELYDLWIATMAIDAEDVQIICLQHVLKLLPPGNKAIVKRLFKTLHHVSLKSEMNKMNESNLAISLAPALVRPIEETIETLIGHAQIVQGLLQKCISQSAHLIGARPMGGLPEDTPEDYREYYDYVKTEIVKEGLPDRYQVTGEDAILFSLDDMLDDCYEPIPPEQTPIAKVQALWRGIQLRKRLKGVDYQFQTKFNSGIWSLAKRENNFVFTLKKVAREFEAKLTDDTSVLNAKSGQKTNDQVIAEAEVKRMLANIKAVCEVHQMILDMLTTLYKSWPILTGLGKVLQRCMPLFTVYITFIQTYGEVRKAIVGLDPNVALLEWLRRKSGERDSRSLHDLLKLPINHLAHWKDPLQSISLAVLESTTYPVEDRLAILKGYCTMCQVSGFLKQLDRSIATLAGQEIHAAFLDLPPFISSMGGKRQIVCHTPAVVDGVKSHIFLFNDIFLQSTLTKQKNVFKFKTVVDISYKLNVYETDKFRLVIDSDVTLEIVFETAEEKRKWLFALQQQHRRWKSGQFGVPLATLCERDQSKVPYLVSRVIKDLHSNAAKLLSSRLGLSADPVAVSALREEIERKGVDSIDLSGYDPDTKVGILKSFLQELPDPIIDIDKCHDYNLYNKAAADADTDEFSAMIAELSPHRCALLREIVLFLAESGVEVEHLAYSWSYCLLWPADASLDSCLKMDATSKVLRTLIAEANAIFSKNKGKSRSVGHRSSNRRQKSANRLSFSSHQASVVKASTGPLIYHRGDAIPGTVDLPQQNLEHAEKEASPPSGSIPSATSDPRANYKSRLKSVRKSMERIPLNLSKRSSKKYSSSVLSSSGNQSGSFPVSSSASSPLASSPESRPHTQKKSFSSSDKEIQKVVFDYDQDAPGEAFKSASDDGKNSRDISFQEEEEISPIERVTSNEPEYKELRKKPLPKLPPVVMSSGSGCTPDGFTSPRSVPTDPIRSPGVAGGVGATPPPVPKRTFSSDDSDETPSDTSPAAPPRVPSRTFSPERGTSSRKSAKSPRSPRTGARSLIGILSPRYNRPPDRARSSTSVDEDASVPYHTPLQPQFAAPTADVSGSKQRAGTLTTNVPYRPARPARKHSTSPPLDPSSSSPRLPPPASPRAPPPKPRLPTMGVPPASAYAPQPAGADGRDDESLPERPRVMQKVLRPPAVNCQAGGKQLPAIPIEDVEDDRALKPLPSPPCEDDKDENDERSEKELPPIPPQRSESERAVPSVPQNSDETEVTDELLPTPQQRDEDDPPEQQETDNEEECDEEVVVLLPGHARPRPKIIYDNVPPPMATPPKPNPTLQVSPSSPEADELLKWEARKRSRK